jgi:RNA-directed DNA polymerase
MQALYLLALNPVAETTADLNSYGFRFGRSIADAHMQCFNSLAKSYSPQWVLEGDIQSCFDRISHKWLLENVLMDRVVLKAWLKAGYLRGTAFYKTEEGTPQGGIISPALANIALDGLEQAARTAVPPRSKVNVVRYADDFIITCSSKELLEKEIRPVITDFLAQRGLRLSPEKTHITHIDDGFVFLGASMRKYRGKFLMTPARSTVGAILQNIRRYLRKHRSIKVAQIVKELNSKIRGWACQFRHLVASRAFVKVDSDIFAALKRWIKRRHPDKPGRWRMDRYFRQKGGRRWTFTDRNYSPPNSRGALDLLRASDLKIIRHVKVRAKATVFNPRYSAYFHQRRMRRKELRGPRPLILSTF